MTDDQKKALIVGGAVVAIALAIYLTKGGIIPAGASGVQRTVAPPSGPGYTSYNVPPYAGVGDSNIYPAPANDLGGCCSGNDGCFTAGGTNTGNAPTSLTQLLNWYQNTPNGQSFAQNFKSSLVAFTPPQPQTLAEMAAPQQLYSNVTL